MQIARANAPEAMRRLIELSQCDDPRVAFMACQAIVERAFGKVAPFSPTSDKAKVNFDLSKLPLTDLKVLMSVMEAARVPEVDTGLAAKATNTNRPG